MTNREYIRIKNLRGMLRLVYGLLPIIAGLDKFTNVLVEWHNYLHPVFPAVFNIEPETFMSMVGIVEIIAGVIVLASPRIGAYVVGFWLIGIAVNLVAQGAYFDIAVRDIVIAIGSFALAALSEILKESTIEIGVEKSIEVAEEV